MKKVLILGNNDQGLYKFRRELIKELLENKYEVVISTPYGEFIPLMQKMGCTYYELEYKRAGKNPFSELKLILSYEKLIRKVRCDIVLMYTIKPTLYAGLVCRIKKIPYLTNITGVSPALLGASWIRSICFFVYRLVLSQAHMVFFQNKDNLQLFQKMKVIKENYQLIPGSGVNLKEYTYQDYNETDKLHILYVGRITKIKGMDEWLESIKTLNHESEDFTFEFVGVCDDRYKEKIASMHDKKQIMYYGVHASALEYIQKAQALIMPSYGEGMSNVLLEASAIGRPVLASNVPGCRECMIDGVTGFCFEPKNSKSIVQAIKKLQQLTPEERKKAGQRARDHVERNFSREIVIKSYMEQINKICKEN